MKYTRVLLIAVIFFLSSISFVEAETQVINDVSVSASTGGNSAESGTVSVGKSKAKAFIKTIVNGEVVEFTDEEIENASGEDSFIKVESEYKDGVVNKDISFSKEDDPQIEVETEAQNTVEQKEKIIKTEEESAEKEFFLVQIFQKFKYYVLSIFS